MPDAPVFRHIPGRRAILCVAAFYERAWENMRKYGRVWECLAAYASNIMRGRRLPPDTAGGLYTVYCLPACHAGAQRKQKQCVNRLWRAWPAIPYFPIHSHTISYLSSCTLVFALRHHTACHPPSCAKVMPAPIINTGEYKFSGGEL